MPTQRPRIGSRTLSATICTALLLGCYCLSALADPPVQGAPADSLAEAPQEWREFLDWAETEINRTPSAVALPTNPRLPQPKWKAQHLEELLDQAEVSCLWRSPTRSSRALVTLGPFRSSSPQLGFLVRDDLDRKLGEALMLTISGFEVACERVGSIAIDIRVPFGEHFDLIWSTGGRIRVPIPDNRKSWPLNIATDGLAAWSGPLSNIQLRTDGRGEGNIEINSLKFLPQRDSFPEPCGIRHVTLDRDRRIAIYTHAPASVEFPNLRLPRKARLQLGLGHTVPDEVQESASDELTSADGDRSSSPLELEVIVRHAGRQASVLKRRLEPGDSWVDASADLGQWGGQEVSLLLKASADSPGSVALWANPVVYEPVDAPPCVVLYLIDTLGAKHMELYGYDRPTSPNIAAFAAEGTCFTRAFCNSPVTVASVSDMLFSMPAERHGVYASSISAPSELVSLAEVLRAAGFATVLFSTNVNAGPRQNTDQGVDRFVDRLGYSWGHAVDRTVPLDEVRSWLQTHADRPTFLYVHTAEPHQPYQPPKGFSGHFELERTGLPEHPRFHPSHADPSTIRKVKLYDEEVLYADARFGMFLDLLSEFGLRGRANITVTADHGEEFMEHGHRGHGPSLHTEVLHIPLIMAGPLVTARGKVDVPVQLHDVMPTILGLLDLPEPYPLSGDSLRPFLQTGDAADRDVFEQRAIVHSHHRYVGLGYLQYALIEGGRWKLMYFYDKQRADPTTRPTSFALYDLNDFLYDGYNVIDDHHELARRLIGRLVDYRRRQHPYNPGLSQDALELDPEQIRELQALGYLDSEEEEQDED